MIHVIVPVGIRSSKCKNKNTNIDTVDDKKQSNITINIIISHTCTIEPTWVSSLISDM